MAGKSAEATIGFSGAPASLDAVVGLAAVALRDPHIVVAGEAYPLRVSAAGQTIDRLSFSMPDATPPGRYAGEVLLGELRRAAVVDVAARRMASIDPPLIDVKAPAGETVEATLNVTNRGNTVLSLDADNAITLRESGTLGKSLAGALKRSDRDLADRLVALGSELQEAPSHEVRVAGRMSPATLDVGARTQVTVELALPADIDTGTTWSGSLGLLGTRVRVRVEPVAART
jgi:hypothetical protein